MNENSYDIIVVGGGHAGIEAAWASAQLGASVAIISMAEHPIGDMPCNPAVGGVGKGQVVRELDALGGLMGELTDLTAVQCRILNESKGYAVQSTRMQVDKDLYAKKAMEYLKANKNISIVRDKVTSIEKIEPGYVLDAASNMSFKCRSLIITTGTFFGGLLHCGEESVEGGVIHCPASDPMDKIFKNIELQVYRFKTGTPPRLRRSSIDFSKMVEQDSDDRTLNFHWKFHVEQRFIPQISCHMTHTNEETLDIIRSNKDRSPLFNGKIKGVGPRYCPSIEDKAFRYPDRNVHHVFVEPEGLDTESVYPNGLSTSLPKDIQEKYIRSIVGFENVEFLEYGYAVEYDVVDSSKLKRTLEHTQHNNLFFAGQVNGTSGYEEAAAQGIIAGYNSALKLCNRDPLIIDRYDSYIGVLIEDLVSNVRDEPYRLFTARSENRLYIREDNVVNRMFKYRKQLFLNSEIDNFQDLFMDEFDLLWDMLDTTTYKVNAKTKKYFEKNNYGPIGANITLSELIKRSKLNPYYTLRAELKNFGVKFNNDVVYSCAISKKYEGYITRADHETSKLRKLEKRIINWEDIIKSHNVSFECRQRITQIKPETFGQLQKIDGIRPATLAFVAGAFLR